MLELRKGMMVVELAKGNKTISFTSALQRAQSEQAEHPKRCMDLLLNSTV